MCRCLCQRNTTSLLATVRFVHPAHPTAVEAFNGVQHHGTLRAASDRRQGARHGALRRYAVVCPVSHREKGGNAALGTGAAPSSSNSSSGRRRSVSNLVTELPPRANRQPASMATVPPGNTPTVGNAIKSTGTSTPNFSVRYDITSARYRWKQKDGAQPTDNPITQKAIN